MKSTKRPSKLPKQSQSNNLNPKSEFVAYRPVEKQQTISQPDSIPNDEPVPQVKPQVLADEEPQNVYPTFRTSKCIIYLFNKNS